MTSQAGVVFDKSNKYGVFGKKKFIVSVRYADVFNRITGARKHEYSVSEDLFNNIMVGAAVTGAFEQFPEGLRPTTFFV